MNRVLVLVRHGESEWNKLNLFTGWRDPGLTENGIAEAKRAGRLLKDGGFRFDCAYTSCLRRARTTLAIMLEELGQTAIEAVENAALNERDYGELAGLNKAEAAARFGEEQVQVWRRSYDIPPPGGESLKDTGLRIVPYYEAEIAPRVRNGEAVIVAAHGNSLRALIMHIEGLTPLEILDLNLATGEPYIYRIASDGSVTSKTVLAALAVKHEEAAAS